MGFDIVVLSNDGKKQLERIRNQNDVEANLLAPEIVDYKSRFFGEEPTCYCLPSCDGIAAIVSHYCDSVSEVFYEVIYGESDVGEKES